MSTNLEAELFSDVELVERSRSRFFTVVFYNLHIFQRPVTVADAGTIIGFNLGVVVAYGMLLTMLVWYFERADRLPSRP